MDKTSFDGSRATAPGMALLGFFVIALALAFAGLVSCGISWFLLMERINHAPSKPSVEQTVPIMRHGMTVFIRPLDNSLLTWLSRGGAFFGVAVFAD